MDNGPKEISTPIELYAEQKVKEYYSENKSFSFKDSKNSSSSSQKFIIHFKKEKTLSEGRVTSQMTININRRKIFCNIKDEKDFFRSIRSLNYYENFKKKLKQYEQKVSDNSMNNRRNEKIFIDDNIDQSSLKITDEDDFLYVEDMNTLKVSKLNKNLKKAETTNEKTLSNKMISQFHNEKTKDKLKFATNINQSSNIIVNSSDNCIINTTTEPKFINDKSKSLEKDYINTSILRLVNRNQSKIISNYDKSKENSNIEGKVFFPLGYTICELCDLLVPKKLIITLSPCEHSFCTRCAKNYYEDKIENGEIYELTCPYYTCRTQLPMDILTKLISEKLLNRYNRLNNKSLLNVNTIKKNTLGNSTNNNLSTYFTTIKEYNQKHVIDVSKNENVYLMYHKYKEHFCQICNLPSLFGKNCKNSLKCLNCLRKFCKFCLNEIDSPDHFNTFNTKNCCKNYLKFYREQMKPKFIKNRFIIVLQRFIMFIASYLFIILLGYFYSNKFMNWVCCEKKKKKNKSLSNEPNNTIQPTSKFNPEITLTKFKIIGNTLTSKKTIPQTKPKRVVYYLLVYVPKKVTVIFLFFVFCIIWVLLSPYFPLISCYFF